MVEHWLTEKHTAGYSVNWKIKETLHKETTPFQDLEIVEMEEFGRALILDGIVQTTVKDEFMYHEMLAQVPLFTHPNPEKVLVVGGGDGGTIREVMKHKEVKEAYLIEIDTKVIAACKEFLPETSYALEDERCHIIIEDGIKYLKEHQNEFDIILIDSSDPIGPAMKLFVKEFYQDIYGALKEDGLFVAQTGSPIFNKDLLRTVYEAIDSIFPVAKTYLTTVPTYVGGFWTFTLGSKKFDPTEIKLKEYNFINRYWNPEIHKEAFSLPEFIKDVLR